LDLLAVVKVQPDRVTGVRGVPRFLPVDGPASLPVLLLPVLEVCLPMREFAPYTPSRPEQRFHGFEELVTQHYPKRGQRKANFNLVLVEE
jgi:hypothetical protein